MHDHRTVRKLRQPAHVIDVGVGQNQRVDVSRLQPQQRELRCRQLALAKVEQFAKSAEPVFGAGALDVCGIVRPKPGVNQNIAPGLGLKQVTRYANRASRMHTKEPEIENMQAA